jgi:hypothetical protein
MSNENKTTKAPVARVKVRNVQAAIWSRSTEKGTFFDVSFQRGYKTPDGNWRNSHSFDLDGLLALQHTVKLAIDKVLELRNADVSDQPATEAEEADYLDPADEIIC